ncbi:hypothetical protein SKDZ_11G1060 [Saccharomyces kudriavzevii ZP591]|nr:hypothetical protein SKDZ_11G1060 [Saccharomyces kudriavzevii ZP591]
MSGRMRNRGMTQENSSDALAAAAAIGNALSNNGRVVDRSKIPQYNQSFTSRTASIAGMNRYTMVTNSKNNSRAPSMNANGNRFYRSTSSLANKGHNSTVDNLNLRRQQKAREDAETTFREFGGHQSSKALNVPNLTSRDNKSRTTSLGSSGGIRTTVKKYIPGPRGLVAVEVPVQKGPSRSHTSSDSNNAGDRAYSLPTGKHNSSSAYRKKTTKATLKTTGSRGRKPKRGIESKGHNPSKVSTKRHTKSSKQQHNDNVPLIEMTMNEETEQELRKDLHGPFEFRPMIISDHDNDSLIGSNRSVLEKNENRLNEREKKDEIGKLLNEVRTLEEKISDIEVEKSNEEEREQNLILELRKVKQNEERRMEVLKRELNIAKENADFEAEELKLIETKRKAHLHDEGEIKSKIETVVDHQRASSKSEPKKLLLEDMGKESSNTQDQSQYIKNSKINNPINTEEDPVNPIMLDSFNDPVFQINSNNESSGNKDSDSLIGSELSDYNCIEGSALDFRATAKTSVESEIHANQAGLKLPPDDCFKCHEEGTKEHSIDLAGRNCASNQNEKDVDQDGLLLDNDEPKTSETLPGILEIDTIRPEKVSGVIRDINDDENVNDYSDEEEEEEDEDEEYHDSYDVIVHEPVQMEQRITNVPPSKYPLEYPNKANSDKNNQQNYNNTEVFQSGTKKTKYLLDANPYLASASSDTLNLDSENLNSKSSTETTRTVPGHSKGSPQPEFKSALKKTLALPSSASSSIYSVDTPSNSNTHIARTTASNTKVNDRRPLTSSLEQKHNQAGLTEIPMMSPKRLEDKRKNLNRLCVRTLRGSCNEASLTYKVSHSSSNSSSSPSCHSTRPSIPVNSGKLASNCASKRYSKAPQTSTTSRESPNRLLLNVNKSAVYPREPPAKKSSFEKERPMNDNLGFRSMSLREPLVTKSTPAMRAGSLEEEERREQKGHFSRKSWNFGLSSPLKAKNHSSHPSNETEEITGSMKDCGNQNPSLYTAPSMNNKENVSQAGTEGHRFSLFKIRSPTLDENVSTGTNALNSTNSEMSTALPLGVPVTIIEKNGEIHKLHNDDAAKKDNSHHHGGHSKFGRKLKKIFGRK